MTRQKVEKVVRISALAALASVLMMVASVVWPSPYLLVLVMSVGQLVGTASLALFLFAIAMDLRRSGAVQARREARRTP